MVIKAALLIFVIFCTLSGLSNAEEPSSVILQRTNSTQDQVMPVATPRFVQCINEALDMKNITEIFNQDPPTNSTQANVMPTATPRFVQCINEALDIKNISEIFNQDPLLVKYSKEGQIDEVILKDGTNVKYSYGYDEKGALSSVTLSTGSLSVAFMAAESMNTQPSTSNNLPQDNAPAPQNDETGLAGKEPSNKVDSKKPADFGKKPEDKPIIIYVPPDSLKQIAHRPIPFDFDKIKDGFDKTAGEKKKAYDEYMKKTTPYYAKILKELQAGADAMKAEGINMDIDPKSINPKEFIDANQRRRIDEMVQAIRARSNERGGEAGETEGFLAVEKMYADEFLSPNRAIYEDKIKKAVEYLNSIIDSVIKSKLAVYLNIKNEKIEAIVNLPEKE